MNDLNAARDSIDHQLANLQARIHDGNVDDWNTDLISIRQEADQAGLQWNESWQHSAHDIANEAMDRQIQSVEKDGYKREEGKRLYDADKAARSYGVTVFTDKVTRLMALCNMANAGVEARENLTAVKDTFAAARALQGRKAFHQWARIPGHMSRGYFSLVGAAVLFGYAAAPTMPRL